MRRFWLVVFCLGGCTAASRPAALTALAACTNEDECLLRGVALHLHGAWNDAAVSYQTGCRLGGAEACVAWAWVWLAHPEVGGESPLPTLARTCAESRLGCALAGWLNEKKPQPGVDPKRIYERGCSGADANACTRLAVLHAAAGRRDAVQVLLDLACTAGDNPACGWRGCTLSREPDRDLGRATKLLGGACLGGDGEACAALAGLYERGDGLARDGQLSASLVERACRLGSVNACAHLAVRARSDDNERVARELAEACGRDIKAACPGAQPKPAPLTCSLDASAPQLPPPPPRAFDQMACQLGAAQSCMRTGPDMAQQLAEQECDAGGTAACVLSGDAATDDDPARAVLYYEAACEQQHAASCGKAGWWYMQGLGVGSDPVRGVALLRQACTLGDGFSCGKLEEAGAKP